MRHSHRSEDQPAVVNLVREEVVRRALSHVLQEAGWQVLGARERDLPVRADGIGAEAAVLVIWPKPARCARALTAFMQGHVRGVVLADEPASAVPALEAIPRALRVVSGRVIVLANELPSTSARDERLLRGIASGHSTRRLALGLGLSEATVKRDIGSLVERFSVGGRRELIPRAIELGILEGG